jgi:thiosulfate/3-mercaptopyruvate sulfurtransferase
MTRIALVRDRCAMHLEFRRTRRYLEVMNTLRVLALLLALPAFAQNVRTNMLVSTDWLQSHLGKVKVLHVGTPADYAEGHIPGAVLLDTASFLVERDGTPNEIPPIDKLEGAFRAAGIGLRGRIILYSNDPMYAARAWFTLDYLGNGDRAAILDGGFAKWKAETRRISREPVTPQAAEFEARTKPDTLVRLSKMSELVRRRDEVGPYLVLLDSRAPAQFSGEEPGAQITRPGHIPGAVNVPSASHFAADGTLRLPEELRALYRAAGVTKDSTNVTYCRSGMHASVSYFVLRYLGDDVMLYDGSYFEWSHSDQPVEP